MKGMVFVGCSFTHGHGLWQYFDFQDNPTDDSCHSLRPAHILSKNSIRFPRIVVNYFNTFEVVRDDFSGDDEDSLGYINQLFNINDNHKYPFYFRGNDPLLYFDFSDISHVIIQTSYPDRCPYIVDKTTKERIQLSKITDSNKFDVIKEWGFTNFDDYYFNHVSKYFNELENKIKFLLEKNINVFILSITNDYYPLIMKSDLLKDKFIHIEYDNKKFISFLDLFEYDKTLKIKNDYNFFKKQPPNDSHPSKKCHEIVAKSIIKKINNYE